MQWRIGSNFGVGRFWCDLFLVSFFSWFLDAEHTTTEEKRQQPKPKKKKKKKENECQKKGTKQTNERTKKETRNDPWRSLVDGAGGWGPGGPPGGRADDLVTWLGGPWTPSRHVRLDLAPALHQGPPQRRTLLLAVSLPPPLFTILFRFVLFVCFFLGGGLPSFFVFFTEFPAVSSRRVRSRLSARFPIVWPSLS